MKMKTLTIPFFCIFLLFAGCTKQAPEHDALVTPEGDVIRVPVEKVNDGGVHFFTYKHEGKNINFFVRTDGKGKLHTHYDACYSCFKYKLGFKIEGNEILCIACGLKYSLNDEIWDYIGPCAPIPLRSRIRKNVIEIKLSTIHRGKKLF